MELHVGRDGELAESATHYSLGAFTGREYRIFIENPSVTKVKELLQLSRNEISTTGYYPNERLDTTRVVADPTCRA